MSNRFGNFAFLNGGDASHPSDDGFLIAIDEGTKLSLKSEFPCLQDKTWRFGYLSYDLKNSIEQLKSNNPGIISIPDHYFFNPGFVLNGLNEKWEIAHNTYKYDNQQIDQIVRCFSPSSIFPVPALSLKARLDRETYLNKVEEIKKHIQQGDIYEMNFCMEFFSFKVNIDPFVIYSRLNKLSEAPFSAFCRFGDLYIISSSPERFLKKEGSKLLSQPIKGTRRRSDNREEDSRLKNELLNDEKERSENVMIVDLVRNDLSRIAKKGTVKVDELFGIYSFPQVHQMISTVSCDLMEETSFYDIIQSTFPMGSMTGAPKIKAMELIDKFENSKRGLYSGALGYISPEGDFDFSVVIRTILYDAKQHYLSFSVGSAITAQSDPEKEYEECLLKAKALLEALNATIVH